MFYYINNTVFFFNDTATTEIYTLSLHDALPISASTPRRGYPCESCRARRNGSRDRKSTRLNSSHGYISYAVFCLKKKKKCIYRSTQNKKTIFEIEQQTNIRCV